MSTRIDRDETLQERLRQFPKDLYFNAEDLKVGTAALTGSEVAVISGRRLADYRRACNLLEELQSAAKPLRSFDRNGNIGMAAANLGDIALEVQKVLRNLRADIAEAEQRYRDASAREESPTPPQSPATVAPLPQAQTVAGTRPVAVEPTPQVQTATGPKPGPHLASVVVFDPDRSPMEQLSAMDRLLDARQLRRVQR